MVILHIKGNGIAATGELQYNLKDFGNQGCSISSLMVTRIADKLRKEQTTIFGSSLGLGFIWGTMLLKMKLMLVLSKRILSGHETYS